MADIPETPDTKVDISGDVTENRDTAENGVEGVASDSEGKKKASTSRSIDRLVGPDPRRPRPAGYTNSAYINDAFSFLKNDAQDAYKYYKDDGGEDIDGISVQIQNNKSAKAVAARLAGKSKEAPGQAGWRTCVIVTCIVLLVGLGVGIGVVYGLGLFDSSPEEVDDSRTLKDYVIDGTIHTNLTFDEDLYNSSSPRYIQLADEFTNAIDTIMPNSEFNQTYVMTEVLGYMNGSVFIRFRVMFSAYQPPDSNRLDSVLTVELATVQLSFTFYEISLQEPVLLSTLTTTTTTRTTTTTTVITTTASPVRVTTVVTPMSTVTEESVTDATTFMESETTEVPQTQATTELVTYTPEPFMRTTPSPAICTGIQEDKCSRFGYSRTGYPNMFGHIAYVSTTTTFNALELLVDQNCYAHTLQFICGAIYSPCSQSILKVPCRKFCQAFVDNCLYPLNCDSFPDDDDPNLCILEPDDAANLEEEQPYNDPCAAGERVCGNLVDCIATGQFCDGTPQCADGWDELDCGYTNVIDCDFEGGDMCGWTNADYDHFEWTLRSGVAPSNGTGPYYDHTLHDNSGSYLLAEGSGRYPYDQAVLASPEFNINVDFCLRFAYHMRGEAVWGLKVWFEDLDGNVTTIWQRQRNQGDAWKVGHVTVAAGSGFILLHAFRGMNYLSDIAIDDVTMRAGECPPQECLAGEFQCGNEGCLLPEFVCNGEDDCGDFTDEMGCDCGPDEYRCDMGMCIPGYLRCNQYYDCPDHSDEGEECVCPYGQFECTSGECIMQEWVCDRETDCPGGEDEQGCPTCGADEFECRDFSCIPKSQVCDGTNHCPDAFDELMCASDDSGMVSVMHGGEQHYICTDGYDETFGQTICTHMGKGAVIATSLSETPSLPKYLTLQSTPGSAFASNFLPTSSCSSGKAVGLTCAEQECGIPSVGDRNAFIINGQNAAPGEWPWQVTVLLNGGFVCGGTLVTTQHVITAGHCISTYQNQPEKFEVLVGSIYRTTLDPLRQRIAIRKVTVHEAYTNTFWYWGKDIAVFLLATEVTYSDHIKPACLPEVGEVVAEDSLCYNTGWGYTDYQAATPSQVLQQAKMQIMPFDVCRAGHSNFHEGMLCAGYDSGYVSSCLADSGGPLVCQDVHGRWKLFGVLSFVAIGCSIQGRPPVFTDVTTHLDWIHENLACAFTCDNGRCIVESEDICNGVDNCGDRSDETRLCSPTVDCDFEDSYQCGYLTLAEATRDEWTRRQGAFAANEGPITDFTFGNNSGHYMLGGMNFGRLMAPVIDVQTDSCLHFRYHIRGERAGRLSVVSYAVDSVDVPIETLENIVDPPTTLFTMDRHAGDVWHQAAVSISPGVQYLGFQAVAQGTDEQSLVAVDDVTINEGLCNVQPCNGVACHATECVDSEFVCDFVTQCDTKVDEQSCTDPSLVCDLSRYGRCGFEQDHTDSRDWQLLIAQDSAFNAPVRDSSGQPGGILYLNTHLQMSSPGAKATIELPIQSQGSDSCLYLTYNMVSQGALKVYMAASGTPSLTWEISAVTFDFWTSLQIIVPAGTAKITLEGVISGNDNPNGFSYIALDGLQLESGMCPNATCPLGEFQCQSGLCIEDIKRCDGVIHCPGDDLDELGCPCPLGTFQCLSGNCLNTTLRCDGADDCGDGSDEDACEAELDCTDMEYACDGECKDGYSWCDPVATCADGTDSQPGCECKWYQVTCDNGYCLPWWWYCDGTDHCTDGSDEPAGCTRCDPRWTFTCATGTNCLFLDKVCDGFNNCGDFSDEVNCTCKADEFQCSNGMCITPDRFCNGFPDCQGSEDEAPDCECMPGYAKCEAGNCIREDYFCDGYVDCGDYSDEANCSCTSEQFKCDNGLCILGSKRCDGLNSCGDYSDELGCECTGSDEFMCNNGYCIRDTYRCDGRDDCMDESDERFCNCGTGFTLCPTEGKCISDSWLCDGIIDCSDSHDESNCAACSSAEFTCGNYSCIDASKRCDGTADCADGLDEQGCLKLDASNDLLFYDQGNWLPICDDNWVTSFSDEACGVMGLGTAVSTESATTSASIFLRFPDGTTQFQTNLLQPSQTCSKVVRLDCLPASCGHRDPSVVVGSPVARIVGGDIAQAGSWPWMAALSYLGEFMCGAALISDRFLLTAGHCLFTSDQTNGNAQDLSSVPQYLEVTLGTTSRSSGGERIRLESVMLHPDYSTTTEFNGGNYGFLQNDIALLKLWRPVTFSSYIQPICLPEDGQTYSAGDVCFLAGWGFSNPYRAKAVNDLREVRFEVLSDDECTNVAAWGFLHNPATFMCAGYLSGTISSCSGDSGGPMMCSNSEGQWSLAGLVSSGSTGCTTSEPNLLARVTAYSDWIESAMEEMDPQPQINS